MKDTILNNLTVLFVDDEDSLRKAIDNAIGDKFKKFIVARDGEDAVKKFKKYKPDTVITDLSMPIKDGLELVKSIKNISKNTQTIVLSAFSDKDKLIGAIDVGVDKYLIKPIDPDELLDVISKMAEDKFSINDVIELGNDYSFDRNKKVLIRKNQIINLTKKEILFVSFLIKHIGTFVLHEDIKKSVWSSGKVNDAAVRTFVKRLREKTDYDFIKNVSGLGYKINS